MFEKDSCAPNMSSLRDSKRITGAVSGYKHVAPTELSRNFSIYWNPFLCEILVVPQPSLRLRGRDHRLNTSLPGSVEFVK